MKILIDARMIRGHHGIGRYTLTLIQGFLRRKEEISILCNSDETLKIIGLDSKIDIINCHLPFAHPAEFMELTAKIHFSKYDIVHLPSFAVPIRSSKNLVVTIHDLIHLHRPSLAHKIYYSTILKGTLARAGAIITVSDWAKNEVSKYLKIDSKKISVVRNGLEPQWFEKSLERKKSEKSYYLCLSNTKNHKNVRTLIKASQILWEQNLDFNLVLSLGGQDLPKEWNIDSLAMSKIRILKNVPDQELQKYFCDCLALISPSFLEGYDYAVAQALTQGRPVILSRGSAHDEFRGKMLFFYGPADNSQDLASAMGKIFDAPPPSSFDHNISTQNQMIDETLSVYRNCLI